jgi:hypothetical protein
MIYRNDFRPLYKGGNIIGGPVTVVEASAALKSCHPTMPTTVDGSGSIWLNWKCGSSTDNDAVTVLNFKDSRLSYVDVMIGPIPVSSATPEIRK